MEKFKKVACVGGGGFEPVSLRNVSLFDLHYRAHRCHQVKVHKERRENLSINEVIQYLSEDKCRSPL